MRNRLVAELVPEGRPGCVVDALRHPGFGEFHSRHVADCDVIEAAHKGKRQFVLEVGPRVCHLGVQLRDVTLVFVGVLRFRQFSSGGIG